MNRFAESRGVPTELVVMHVAAGPPGDADCVDAWLGAQPCALRRYHDLLEACAEALLTPQPAPALIVIGVDGDVEGAAMLLSLLREQWPRSAALVYGQPRGAIALPMVRAAVGPALTELLDDDLDTVVRRVRAAPAGELRRTGQAPRQTVDPARERALAALTDLSQRSLEAGGGAAAAGLAGRGAAPNSPRSQLSSEEIDALLKDIGL